MPHSFNRSIVTNARAGVRASTEDKRRIGELEQEVADLKKKLKKAKGTDDDDGKKALQATRRNLARAQALRASGELNRNERDEIDEIIRQCNEILAGETPDSGRSPGPHALGSLASLPPEFRNIIERPRNSGRAHVDKTGIALDVDFDPATAAEMLADMEGR